MAVHKACGRCSRGVVGWDLPDPQIRRGVTKLNSSRRVLEEPTEEGESPVDERIQTPGPVPEYRGTRETLWETGRTISQG
jgi:hypothetical protein